MGRRPVDVEREDQGDRFGNAADGQKPARLVGVATLLADRGCLEFGLRETGDVEPVLIGKRGFIRTESLLSRSIE